MTEVSFVVIGVPIPAGSKRAFVNPKTGRALVVDANTKTKPWQKEVREAAIEAMEGSGLLHGAILLEIGFFRPRPKDHYTSKGALSAHGERNPYPTTKPDMGKLTRAIEDALKAVVWRDDSQVCAYRIMKVWGEPARAMVTVKEIEPDVTTL